MVATYVMNVTKRRWEIEMVEYFANFGLIDALQWIIIILSLSTAFMLSRGGNLLIPGRIAGVCSEVGWFSYGLLTDQYFIIFLETVYLFIYLSAIAKMYRKRDQYKGVIKSDRELIRELRDENAKLENKLKKVKEML